MPDKFEIIEENAMDVAAALEQKGLAPARDALVRFFLEGEPVDYIEDEDIGKRWAVACEWPLDSHDLGGLAMTVKRDGLAETPFRRDMLEAAIGAKGYAAWNDLASEAAGLAETGKLDDSPVMAYWGAIVEHDGGFVRISECWSPEDAGMSKELIAEMPLAGFMKKDAPEKVRMAGAPKM